MKKLAKSIVVAILGWQVRRLRKKNDFKIVAVVGSTGKTSTKYAIANVLASDFKVLYQAGNYNDIVSVPLIFFGHDMPSLFSPLAWLGIFISNEKQLSKPYPWEVVVLELGTDSPDIIAQFERYLHLDIAVLASIAPEHMEFFGSLKDVAEEELSVRGYADTLVVNADLCAREYLNESEYVSYGMHEEADYRLTEVVFERLGHSFTMLKGREKLFSAFHPSISEVQLYSVAAAVAVADQLGMDTRHLSTAIRSIKPVSGRMKILEGIKKSVIWDDTYNASPVAVKAALSALYKAESPHKIALLGNMNELGQFSEEAHRDIGAYCDPQQLDYVVTIGHDANTYLAEEARKRGCNVKTCADAPEAGDFIKTRLARGTIVLAKGSQNGVYAEEAVKLFLDDPSDSGRLVRQSPMWISKKRSQGVIK